MEYKRILTVQDISCVGQCSLTVALPILSACGVETCILPSAVLSTHTAGFSGYTFRDLAEDILPITRHWEKENIEFDAVYTGYLGSMKQIGYVKELKESRLKKDGVFIVDPAMADNGKLYPAFDLAYAEEMKKLCSVADVIVPNITEACFLTGETYRTEYDENYIKTLMEKLCRMGAKTVVLTGVGSATERRAWRYTKTENIFITSTVATPKAVTGRATCTRRRFRVLFSEEKRRKRRRKSRRIILSNVLKIPKTTPSIFTA